VGIILLNPQGFSFIYNLEVGKMAHYLLFEYRSGEIIT